MAKLKIVFKKTENQKFSFLKLTFKSKHQCFGDYELKIIKSY